MTASALSQEELDTLLALKPGWSLSEDGNAVSADIKFDDFIQAWSFMTRIAIHAEKLNHHPEWSNVYNRVSIRLTTHDTGGLTALDLTLAQCVHDALG